MTKQLFLTFIAGVIIFFFSCTSIQAKEIQVTGFLENENRTLNNAVDLHLTDENNPLRNATVNLTSEETWLFFDNMKPSTVLEKYGAAIRINNQALNPNANARVSIYIQGTVIIPHTSSYKSLETFNGTGFSGNSYQYDLYNYYTNASLSDTPAEMKKPLTQDNAIRSFKLKRGYMATFANNPDGTGYSRVFIADKEDILMPEIPALLDKKVSFIRVTKWEWVSKKGWCDVPADIASKIDRMNATWFYTWGAESQPTANQEFVPEKWGQWWPTWSEINAHKNVNHLLGYNEPDHSEQSNLSVDYAISQWPEYLKTGLRLGSPATTDFNWLYNFLKKCDENNYRVDYVVVHAYWGGKSAASWYNDLKNVHERTGRPIWIKEWNNGANWTGEPWPSNLADQQQKQLTDLQGIIQVMDTAHFIERYSIYDVTDDMEQKRRLFLNGNLTPAGVFYANNKSRIAYDSNNEIIPVWHFSGTPTLNQNYNDATNEIVLSWNTKDVEYYSGHIVERKTGNEAYQEVARLNSTATQYAFPISALHGDTHHRLKSVTCEGSEILSNEIASNILERNRDIFFQNLSVNTFDWAWYFFNNSYSQSPAMICGIPSYKNRYPFCYRIRNLNSSKFEFHLNAWNYMGNAAITTPEQVALLAVPEGTHQWGAIKAKAGSCNASRVWRSVTFDEPFDVIPIVLATQKTDKNPAPTAVRVRNVTQTGFEIKFQKEATETQNNATEEMCYLAVTPGTGSCNGYKIKAGRTPNYAVGGISSPYEISFGETFSEPALFGFMQTESDDITSVLRYSTLTGSSARIFKQRENSAGADPVSPETVGWLVMDRSNPSSQKLTSYSSAITLSPNPVEEQFLIEGVNFPAKIEIFNTLGVKLIEKNLTGSFVEVSELNKGMYILRVNGKETVRFIKK